MVIGDKSTFAIELEQDHPSWDPNPRRIWGYASFWIANVQLGFRKWGPDLLANFGDFLDRALANGFRQDRTLISLEPHEKSLAVYRNVYSDRSALPTGTLTHHVLAPTGSEFFDGVFVCCFDEPSDALVVAIRPEYQGDLYWDEVDIPDVVLGRVPRRERDRLLTTARDWIRALN